MTEKRNDSRSTWTDPDEAPELTDEWFEGAALREGARLIRRGRPLSGNRKYFFPSLQPGNGTSGIRAGGPDGAGRRADTRTKRAGRPHARPCGRTDVRRSLSFGKSGTRNAKAKPKPGKWPQSFGGASRNFNLSEK